MLSEVLAFLIGLAAFLFLLYQAFIVIVELTS